MVEKNLEKKKKKKVDIERESEKEDSTTLNRDEMLPKRIKARQNQWAQLQKFSSESISISTRINTRLPSTIVEINVGVASECWTNGEEDFS